AKGDRSTKGGGVTSADEFAAILEQFGSTEFTGREEDESKARVLGVIPEDGDGNVAIVLDRTPFYAESGGQIGDTRTISSPTGIADVLDTDYAIAGQLTRHRAHIREGTIEPGEEVDAAIDGERRAAIRRNHTATHLLHWALREVLGDHVK